MYVLPLTRICVFCFMLKLLPSKRSHSSVDLLKTDLTFFTPPEFVYYHMCVSVLSEGSVESALEYAAKSEGSDVIGLAACTAVIAKVVASTASNSGLNAVMRMNPAALALLKRLCSAGTNVENVSKFLITSFVSEEKCLAFLQNKDVLALLGMESLYIPTSSTSHMTHPLFTVLTSHPLYPDYMFFTNGMTSDNNSAFVASLEKRVQDTSDNKPRFKRKKTASTDER